MTPQLVEEYVLETADERQNRVYHTRLTILQRLANDEYIGELYVERDYREEDKKGSTCSFLLGTRTNAQRYINQFTEVFTEEGRKNVKITHIIHNQQPRVTFTAGMRASPSPAQPGAVQSQATTQPEGLAARLQNLATAQPGAAQSQTTQQPQAVAVLLQKKTPGVQQLQVKLR